VQISWEKVRKPSGVLVLALWRIRARARDGDWEFLRTFPRFDALPSSGFLMNEFYLVNARASSPDRGHASSTVLSFWRESCIGEVSRVPRKGS